MTREQTKEAIKVMQAYVDGKEITARLRASVNVVTDNSPLWDWDRYDYRIKPQPTYRPFKSADEVMDAIMVHGDWVNHNGRYYRILEITDKGCAIGTDRALWRWSESYPSWTFLDGTPFGVKEEAL